MKEFLLIVGGLSLLGAAWTFVRAARHTVRLEQCRNSACKPEARP